MSRGHSPGEAAGGGKGDGVATDVLKLSPLADEQLLREARSGGQEAFRVLFERHYEAVHRVLSRLVGDQADDLAQEVFWRLYTRPPRGPEPRVRAWLCRVATNLAYNALRGARRRDRYEMLFEQRPAATPPGSADGDPEAWLGREQEVRDVRAALARLKRREAQILALRYSGLSYREVADALGVAQGSVGTLLGRAEEAFRRAYAEVTRDEEGATR